jgi:hypothetical protein
MTEWAYEQLGENFCNRFGVIYPAPGYIPTEEDMKAVECLVREWFFIYEASK